MITIILPCAGQGSRLDLPYAKETFVLESRTPLIDNTLKLLFEYKAIIEKIVIVTTAEKPELLRHIQKKWNHLLPICFQLFQNQYKEYPGSILSAQMSFGEKNVVLLPDTVVIQEPGHPILPFFDQTLQNNCLSFAYKKLENQQDVLSLGGLELDPLGQVLAIKDKPQDYQNFQAFWGSFAFQKGIAQQFLSTLEAQVCAPVNQKKKINYQDFQEKPFPGLPISKYFDLGTWTGQSIYLSFLDKKNTNQQ